MGKENEDANAYIYLVGDDGSTKLSLSGLISMSTAVKTMIKILNESPFTGIKVELSRRDEKGRFHKFNPIKP